MRQPLLAIPFVLVTACTDASSTADLSCVGNEPRVPTTVSQGFVLDEVGGAPISRAFVELIGPDGTLLGDTATDDSGAYAMTAAGGTFRHAVAEGYLDAYAYATPFDGGPAPLPMLTQAGAEQASRTAGVTFDPAKGMLLIVALDCAGHPIEGANIHVPGAEAVLYLGPDTHFDPTRTSTSRDSAALVLGAPVGQVDVEIEIDGTSYRSEPVASRANALVTSWRHP